MGSSSNKYFEFCPNRTIYSLGKQRNENVHEALSEHACSSACHLSHEKGFDRLNVASLKILTRF